MRFVWLLLIFSSVVRAQSLDFTSDLENFQQSSLQMAVEKGRLEAAKDQHFSKKMFWTPDVSLSAGKSRIEIKDGATSEPNSWKAEASLNLFRGGGDLALLDSADADEKAQTLAVRNEELRVEVLASDLIFKNIYLHESLRIQNELFKLKEDAVRIVRERYNSGKTPLQEVSKSEVDLGQQKNKLRLAELTLSENESSIRTAFVKEIKSKSWPFTDRETLRAKAEDKSPAVEQKYWGLKSSESSLRAAKREFWPTLDFSLQYEESPIQQATLKETTSVLTLTLPLWSKYETAASVSSAFAGYLAADADYRNAERAATVRKTFLSEKVESVRQNLLDSKTNLQKSRELYKDMLRAFQLGKISTNDLLVEQGRLLESESNLVDAQLSFHQTVVESCALQGSKVNDCVED